MTEKPGQYPYTRGIHPTMYNSKPWTIRQYSGTDDAAKTNERFKYLLEQGQTGLSTAFDLPTQMGYDPDSKEAHGEIGRAGVSISTIQDMEALLADIPMDKISLSMTINATSHILLSFLVSVSEKRGYKPEILSGTVQNDILKEFIARGCYAYPVEPSLKIAVDLIEYSTKHLPSWNYISVSGYHIREAGSTATQEVAFTIANALCYMQKALERGLDKDSLGKRISFFFNSHNNLFEEVAKFRAARRLWAKLARQRLGFSDEACKLRFHAQTAGSALTSKQPYNNLMRVTYQVLAAVLGGAQSIHANGFDEALGLPTEESARLAIRTQQIVMNEMGIRDVADPFGGSYVLEQMTDRIEAEAMEYISKIDKLGGPVRAIESRFYQTEIEKEQIKFQQEIESGKRGIVGVTKYTSDENDPSNKKPKLHKISDNIEKQVIENFRRNTSGRDRSKVSVALNNLKSAASSNANIMSPTLLCCKAGATLGEISNALREVYGIFK